VRPAHHQTSRISIKTPPAPAGQRIGLMGGSFNPPHEAHVMVAQTALRRLRLDQVWWLVSPGNPLKTKQGLPTLSQRIAACRAITSHNKRIHITGLESEIGSVYTADTVTFLTNRYAAVRFVWVMGADNLAEFHRWKRWREIASTLPIAVIDRPGWHLAGLSSPAARAFAKNRLPESRATALPFSKPPAWIFLSTRLSPQSSTALRTKTYKNQ
jgi:nicotinate-nucleotide adenylyltransferase